MGVRWQAEERAAKPGLSLSIQHNSLMANPIVPHAPLKTVSNSSPQMPRLKLRVGCRASDCERPALDMGRACGESGSPVGGTCPAPVVGEMQTLHWGAQVCSETHAALLWPIPSPTSWTPGTQKPKKQGVLLAQRLGAWLDPYPLTLFPRPGGQFSTKTRRPSHHRNRPHSQSKPRPSVSLSGQGWE